MVYGGLIVGCIVLAVVLITAEPSRGVPTATEGARVDRVRVLQMNLCNSGLARCYTGRSVATAVAVIRAQAPDLVTLNEVCRADVPVLDRALADTEPFGATTSAFQPALDRRTGSVVRCRNGEPYGIALLTRRPPLAPAYRTVGGIYPTQNPGDPEERAWLCVNTTGFAACTTHLDAADATVARAQCDYLMRAVLPSMRTPAVLGGDFNLGAGIEGCLAAGDRRIDDGGVQDVVVSAPFTITSQRRIDMRASTDHPGLLATAQLRTAATANVV
jgi:endonuclease/exonuclease/phosphatase family metal-dependent hydrolase